MIYIFILSFIFSSSFVQVAFSQTSAQSEEFGKKKEAKDQEGAETLDGKKDVENDGDLAEDLKQKPKEPAPNEGTEELKQAGATGEAKKDRSWFIPQIENIFTSPTAVRNIQAGTVFLNNSVDSLMEGIFYNLLDNEFVQKFSDHFWFSETLNRTVFTTSQGKYVVMDRFAVGPRYKKELANFYRIPLDLGIDTSVEISDIYLQSDAQRVAEKQTLPYWRQVANDWFGLLPFLEKILPPSFNPSEMYDPLHQLKTPFVFPLDEVGFDSMPMGTIRSYAVTGGLSLPLNIGVRAFDRLQDIFKKMDARGSIPYTVFVQGEYRINVLKKNEKTAWVALSQSDLVGHSIAGFLGSTFYLLKNSIKPIPWGGILTQFSLLDVDLSQSLIERMDQLYEFDMNSDSGKSAYEQAIRGDFTFEENKPYVRFHFKKTTKSNVKNKKNSKKLVLIYKELHEQELRKSEIKIKDERGDFFILEDTQSFKDEKWNTLVGSQEEDLSGRVEINVEKVKLNELDRDDPEFVYQFHKNLPPYQIYLQYQIRSRYTHMGEFKGYLHKIKNFTRLDLKEVPDFPLVDDLQKEEKKKKIFMSSPSQSALNIHAVKTSVGKFNAVSVVYLDHHVIADLLGKSSYELRSALETFFYEDGGIYARSEDDSVWTDFKRWGKRLSLYPLRVFDFKFPGADAFIEIEARVLAFEKLKLSQNPKDFLANFYDLFDTDYPDILLSALYELVDLSKVPRKVSFYMSPESRLSDAMKTKLEKINELVIDAGVVFPNAERYDLVAQKLDNFNPTNLRDVHENPIIHDVILESKDNFILLKVKSNTKSPPPVLAYLKIQSHSNLSIDSSLLDQVVTSLRPLTRKNEEGLTLYGFYIFGPQAPWKSLNNLKDFKELILNVSLSFESASWSNAKSIKLKVEGESLSILK